jgi:toxin ParE1/3/4
VSTLPVTFRAEALSDLESISTYISLRDEAAAARVVQRIHRVIFNTIAVLPRCGRLDVDTGFRQFPVPGVPYLVLYVPQAEFIDIVAIFHSSRDPATKPRP